MVQVCLVLAAIICLAIGIGLIRRGHWPRRIGDTPHCPGCGYILTGIQIQRCPECGRGIWPGNIVRGERHRKTSLTLAGFGLVLVPVALFVVVSGGMLQQIEWYHFRPAAWVLKDLDATAPATRDKAWAELQRRLAGGSLSPAKQNALVERALREQQSTAANSFTPAMLDFLGARYVERKLSAAQADAFFANAMKLQLDVRPVVGRDDPIPFRVSGIGHGPLNGWWMRSSQRGYWVDDKKVDRGSSSGTGGFSGWSSTSRIDPQSPGKHRLRVAVEIGAGTGNIASIDAPLDHPRTVELTADFQVRPDNVPVNWVISPSAATIEKCLSAVDFAMGFGSPYLSGSIQAANPAVNLAFEAVARIDGMEYSLGTMSFKQSAGANSMSSYFVSLQSPPPGDFRKIDILLRSSERAVKETIDYTTAWKGEIVIHDVQVRRPPASQPSTKSADGEASKESPTIK